MYRTIFIDSALHWKIIRSESSIIAICTRLNLEVIATNYIDLFSAMDQEVAKLFEELYNSGKLAKYVYDHGLAIRVMDFDERVIIHTPAPIVIAVDDKGE